MTKRKQKTVKATQEYIDSLGFLMMPRDGGQIVEVTYAVDEYGVWCQSYDRSDRTRCYQFANYSARATEEQLDFEPQNGKLPRHNKWYPVIISNEDN